MAHTFSPSTQKAKAGGPLWVQGQPGLQNEFLYHARPKKPAVFTPEPYLAFLTVALCLIKMCEHFPWYYILLILLSFAVSHPIICSIGLFNLHLTLLLVITVILFSIRSTMLGFYSLYIYSASISNTFHIINSWKIMSQNIEASKHFGWKGHCLLKTLLLLHRRKTKLWITIKGENMSGNEEMPGTLQKK